MNNDILTILDANILCVLSTVNASGKPEAAIVGYRYTGDFELIIGTSKLSRKFANLTAQPAVAVVAGGEMGEVQYEGMGEVLSHEGYDAMVAEGVIPELPGAAFYRNDPNQMYVKITPSWIRVTTHGKDGGVRELKF